MSEQPEGTQLAAQQGEVMGGPEVPDPETPLSDAEHAIGQVIRVAGSWQMLGGRLDASHVAGVVLGICAPWTGVALPGMELPAPALRSPVAEATGAGEGKNGTEEESRG